MSELEGIALRLRDALKNRQAIAPIRSQIGEENIAAAYEIQTINTQHGVDQGRTICGRKIGLTSVAVQQQLGVNQPDFGVLFADMARAEYEQIETSQLIYPRIEAEIAFVFGKSMDGEAVTMADLLGSIEYVVPALEIVDSRVENWDIKITDTVADNASCGLYVLGTEKRSLTGFNLRNCGMVMENQTGPVSFGTGAACLGSPLNACLWLAKKMIEFNTPLQEGDLVMSGALGPMVSVSPGDNYHARIANLGSVTAHFEG
jgi:2-keto-4-pentenoate hydratase